MNLDREAEREQQRIQRAQRALDDGIARKGNGKDHDAIALAAEAVVVEDVWPAPLDGSAYHGLAGEIVNLILPQSESDPAALLVQTLTAFGALVGRGAWYQVEATRHFPNLFTLLVGGTSKARKGTSWDRVLSVFGLVHDWVTTTTGLSSGEGFKYLVRDARPRPKRYARRGKVRHDSDPDFEEEEDNDEQYQGVIDKRLLVTEPEFAMVLRILTRQGNTLSGTLRQVYDTGNLNVCTRKDPIRATGAHIAIIGHITPEELRKEMTETDMANGLGNRFLLCCAKRSKCLPRGGGDLDSGYLDEFARDLAERAGKGTVVGRMRMTEPAYELWDSVYPGLSEGKPGLVGAMTARSEAQVVRWALPYALLDGKAQIGVEHLEAALAIVAYSERCVRYVWPAEGSGRGDPAFADTRAQRMKGWLRDAGAQGLTSNAIRDLFQRNISSRDIHQTLSAFVDAGFVTSSVDETGKPGRPATRWIWRQGITA